MYYDKNSISASRVKEEKHLNQEYIATLNVLYVEDEPVLRDEISLFLKRRLKNVFIAENGKEALEKFQLYPIDFIVTDLKMPICDGIELTKEIRKISAQIPIIITTALSDVALMQTSIEIGIDRYLIKPLDAEALTKMLESVETKLKSRNQRKDIKIYAKSKLLERAIETELAKKIKETTGKGPSKVQAFVHANLVEIIIQGARTTFELTLLQNPNNKRIGDYVREVYYGELKEDIEEIVTLHSGYQAIWQSFKGNSSSDTDVIKLILEM